MPKKVVMCREDYWCFAELIKKCRDTAGLQQCHETWGCVLNSCSTHRAWSLAVFLYVPTGALFLLAYVVAEYSLHSFHHSYHNSLLNEANTIRKNKTHRHLCPRSEQWCHFLMFPSCCLPSIPGNKKSKCKCQWNLVRHRQETQERLPGMWWGKDNIS